MTRIILDNFRRRWLLWALFCLMCVFAGIVLGIERDIRVSGILWVPISIAAMDWGFGCVRVLLLLPITARKVGRAYWWLTVCGSTLLFAVFSGIGILILKLAGTHGKFLGPWIEMFIATGPQDKFLGLWLETVLAGGLICGSTFAFMWGAIWTAALAKAGGSWRKRVPLQLYAWAFILAVIGGFYLFYKSPIGLIDKVVIAYLFGFIFSVLGWFRAERLFIDHSRARLEFADAGISGIPRGKFEPRSGYGGVPYLMARFCLFYLSILALLIALTIVMVCIAIRQEDHGDKWSDIVPPLLLAIQIYLFLFCFVQAMIVGTHLKFLRSLPLTSEQLASTILCIAILPVLIFGGPWIVFFLIKPGLLPSVSALSLVKFCLLNLAPVCVLTIGAIWYNEKSFRRITGIIVVWIVSMVPLIYQLATDSRGGLPNWIMIAVPVFSIFLALFTIRRLLERNEMTYRIKFELPPGWS